MVVVITEQSQFVGLEKGLIMASGISRVVLKELKLS